MGWLQDQGKKLGKAIKPVTSSPIANIATLGTTGTLGAILDGDVKGAVLNSGTAGYGGRTGDGQNGGIVDAVTGQNGFAGIIGGLGGMFEGLGGGLSANPADSANFISSTNQNLNPAMAKFQELGGTTISGGNVDPAFRQYQMQVAQQLQQQALGQGPSLAQMQLQQATDRTLNQSLGQIRAATGPNAALAGRTAALAASQQLGGAGNQSAQLRLQEQQQAQAALAGLANQGRTGDAAIRGQDIQAQTATADTRLGAAEGYGTLATEKVKAEGKVLDGQQEAAMQTSKNKAEITKAGIGALADTASAAAKAFIPSDEKLKKNIKPGDVQALLQTVNAKEFDYKDPKNGQGKQIGVMAQDLEKTPYGKSMVIDTPQGKMVDTRKVAMAALAGVAALTKKKAKE